MSTLLSLIAACAPLVAADTAQALIAVESAGNPFAIGVVGGALVRQPRSLDEALATTAALDAAGWDYSVGLGQINKRNFGRLHLTVEQAFRPCANLGAMQVILAECFGRASQRGSTRPNQQVALRDALSCYYSGNFTTGHRHGYVGKVVSAWVTVHAPIYSSQSAQSLQGDPSPRR